MGYLSDLLNNNLSLFTLLDTIKYKTEFRKEHPTFFDGDGLIVFTGAQGEGKTLSAVKYCCEILKQYPKCKFCTNLMIKDYPIKTLHDFIRQWYGIETHCNFEKLSSWSQEKIINDYIYLNRVFPFNNADDLKRYHNGEEGVLYLIDEIQLYFNSLESKNINMDVMTEIAQQRKQRKNIVCTSQVFGRMAKPLREQFNTIVKCHNFASILQRNWFIRQEDIVPDTDMMNPKGIVNSSWWFFHSRIDYERYDTYYKIEKTRFVDEERKVAEIYDRYTMGSSD